jgi:hypothetical protein
MALAFDHIWIRRRAGWVRYTLDDIESGRKRVLHPSAPHLLLILTYEDADVRVIEPAWDLIIDGRESEDCVEIDSRGDKGKKPN